MVEGSDSQKDGGLEMSGAEARVLSNEQRSMGLGPPSANRRLPWGAVQIVYNFAELLLRAPSLSKTRVETQLHSGLLSVLGNVWYSNDRIKCHGGKKALCGLTVEPVSEAEEVRTPIRRRSTPPSGW